MTITQPWPPSRATTEINEIAKSKTLAISYKKHAVERMRERDLNLIVTDILYALKNGFVYQECVPATRAGHFRYRIECRTPNSGSRAIGIVVIPAKTGCLIKVVSVMWIDEFETKAGSIIGVDEDE